MIYMRKVNGYLRSHGILSHDAVIHFPWWRQSFLGYPVGLFFVIVMVLASLLLRQPYFAWTSFCLVVVLVGFVWDVGPALVTMTLGFLGFSIIAVPQYVFLTMSLWDDARLFGPFLFAQFVIALFAVQHAVKYRQVFMLRQEIYAYTQELVAADQQLERINRLKDYFMSRAAHELRTPLTTILGEVQLALRRLNKVDGTTTEFFVWRKHFEKIEEGARSLQVLVEELIDLGMFRSGEMHLQIERCDFGRLCRDAIESLQMFSKHPIEFKLPSSPIILQADRQRLFQVIINVVSNAMQYAVENTAIHIDINTEHSCVIFQVHNEGPVLSSEQQECLFEPFYRTPYVEAVFREGWGLGLTISKEIVERHGGQIWVESSAENGITCFVRIPRQAE